MIINYDSPGQLCNRIWSLVPSIAYGLKYKEKVLVINMDGYTEPFDNLNKNRLVQFASHKLIKRALMSFKARGYIQNGRSNIFRRLFGFNFVEGWSNRLGNAEMVEEQSTEIRNIFSFNTNIANAVDSEFAVLPQSVIVVGVHIRRGDYKEWLDGIYYYTDEEYVCILRNIKEQFESRGQQVKFLLCSNEKINLENYNSLERFTLSCSSGSHDLYALSKCDYIIGPPSSYSQWASFWGKVPVKFIKSAREIITLSDFSEIISFNRFSNGSILNID